MTELVNPLHRIRRCTKKWYKINHNYHQEKSEQHADCTCDDYEEQNCKVCNDWSLKDSKQTSKKVLIDNTWKLKGNTGTCIENIGHVQSQRHFGELGPLLDDGAPHSAIGLVELKYYYSLLE